MTTAQLHNFLIQPSQLGQCMSVRELVFDLQVLGRNLGPTNEWGPVALMRQDEAGKVISGWLAELERGGLAKEVGGKWVGVVEAAEVKEREVQKGLF